MEQQVHLLGGWVGCTLCGYPCTIVAIFLHELADVLKCTIQLVEGMKLSQFELRGIDNLVCIGAAGSAFDLDSPHEKVGGGDKSEDHAITRPGGFGLDIG